MLNKLTIKNKTKTTSPPKLQNTKQKWKYSFKNITGVRKNKGNIWIQIKQEKST